MNYSFTNIIIPIFLTLSMQKVNNEFQVDWKTLVSKNTLIFAATLDDAALLHLAVAFFKEACTSN